MCVHACGKGRANQSSSRYSYPRLFYFGLLHPPIQWFLLQYKSQPALFSLTYTHAHTHRGRPTCTHTHTSINPLTTRQCPEQIKGLHISNGIPNVPPLHGSASSSSCTFSSFCCATTGHLLCTFFCCFFLFRSVFNLWQPARLPLQLR